WHTNKLVLGKLSGRAAVKARFEELGISFATQEELDDVFKRFKALADKKTEIFDEDLHSLISHGSEQCVSEHYELVDLEVCSKTGITPKAQITLRVDGELKRATAEGSGPVDASYKAIEQIADSHSHLQLYSVNAITSGTDSQGEVTVRLERKGHIVNGIGSDTDIVAASAKAYLHALNLLDAGRKRSHPQHDGV
ncbi:MAG: 2-isopropylmalate synthase, partial [Pseudomonadota bacterium]